MSTEEQAMSTRELLRFAFAQGSKQTIVGTTVFPGWLPRGGAPGPYAWDLAATTAGTPPEPADLERATSLPFGTVDILQATPFPVCPATGAGRDRVGHALVTAFGPQRREPSNVYNDHRAVPSVRSKFPVHAFVARDRRYHWLDVYRHALLDMGVPAGPPESILLAARYSDLPSPYGRLRGPLTELELGINLRALCAGLDLFGVPYRVGLPDHGSESRLHELRLEPAWGWTLPVTVWPWPSGDPAPAGSPPASRETPPGDALLREVVAVNRLAALSPAAGTARCGRSVPAAGPAGVSWAEVLWARSSGTMPRGLKGLAGRRRVQPFSVVRDTVDWLGAEPPAQLLRQVSEELTVTACLQDIEGAGDGVYRLAGRELSLLARHDDIGAELERDYGNPQGTEVGCGVRVANVNWFVSVRPRRLIERGPWAWPLALLAAGWMAQGICFAAAAHGLYARPARAFQEIPVQPLLRLSPDELLLVSVTCGTPRFAESALDLRL